MITVSEPLWAAPHHDGSATYVSDMSPSLGDSVTVFLRVPHGTAVERAMLRVYIDGEQALIDTAVDRVTDHDTWLRADVPVDNPVVNYRWLLNAGPSGYQWLNGTGIHDRDVTDAADFRITTYGPPPSSGSTWSKFAAS